MARTYKIQSERLRILLLGGLAVFIACGLLLVDPIAQNPSYHHFADTNPWAFIPNWQNVLSNLPFAIVGLMGLRFVVRNRSTDQQHVSQHLGWATMFTGVFFTAMGSAYYHWRPDNFGLFWDRLPMTIGFSGFFASIIGERVGTRSFAILFWPLMFLGLGSVIYWLITESHGYGDLRPYVFVQFFPLFAIPIMIVLFPPRYSHSYLIILALTCYGMAKVFEDLDEEIWKMSDHWISGHAIKHLWAAFGCYLLLVMLKIRRIL